MYCVGLTGTIASGKSTVAAMFAKLNIQIISADHIAKKLTSYNQPAVQKITEHFGQSVLSPTGELNRKLLREIIFNNPAQRLWLEGLLHPMIRKQIEHEITQVKTPYCIIEIPLLTDRSTYPYLNRVLLVSAQVEQQIQRVMKRDNCSKKHALSILAAQSHEQVYRGLADDILMNDGNLAELEDKIIKLNQTYLKACE